MYFYKYQKVGSLELMQLKRGEIFFASPSELNDRHECRPIYLFNGSKEVWRRFIHWILVELCFKYNLYSTPEEEKKLISLHIPMSSSVYSNVKGRSIEYAEITDLLPSCLSNSFNQDFTQPEKKYILRCLLDFIKTHFKNALWQDRYICSFSMTATNPTMWAHYGATERGFITIYKANNNYVEVKSTTNLAGFSTDNETIATGNSNTEKLELKKVVYRKNPAKINVFHRLIPMFHYTDFEYQYDVPENLISEIKSMEESNVGLTKFTDWKYEKELRLLFPTHFPLNKAFRCLQVEHTQIKGIIFGSKTSEEDKHEILMACQHLKLISSTQNHFAVFQAFESDQTYKMNIEPLGLLNENYMHYNNTIPLIPLNELTQSELDYLIAMHKDIQTT